MSEIYIALLRGINVGGKNKISMQELKQSFANHGFTKVETYINSGNILFESNHNLAESKRICENLIQEDFGLCISVCVISAKQLIEASSHQPEFWNVEKESKHNAIFVIPPASVSEIVKHVGTTKPEMEQVGSFGQIIFWSAPLATFSKTRWTKIVQNKAYYQAITIRNANTFNKLVELVKCRNGN